MTRVTAKTLIVEDDKFARRSLTDILRNRGFEVEAVEDGQQALQLLRNQSPPDVILLDMLLPKVDGWRFLQEFDRLNVRPKPWIIITTGSPGLGREWAADHGCAGFLTKPIDEEELFDEIQRCLNKTVEANLTEDSRPDPL
ncbi:MAG: response regulator [Gemmataceae bacterium]